MATCFICGEDTQWRYACEDVLEDGSKDCWNDYRMRRVPTKKIRSVINKLREMPKDQMLLFLAMGDLNSLVTDYERG
jgi:hypothetical protein